MKRDSARRPPPKFITTARSVPIRGPLTKLVSTAAIARLVVLATEDQGSPMLAYITSPGGLASEALRVISTMDGIGAPIATFCRGRAGGPAAILAAHGRKGFRAASPACVFSFTFDSERHQHISHSSSLELLVELVARDTGQSPDKVKYWLANKVELTAEAARANGLIDHISAQPILPAQTGA